MGKLLTSLEKQLKTDNKQEAEDCIKIYNHLKETNNGRVWESQWNNLITTVYSGTYPNSIRISIPNATGYLIIKALTN